MDLAQISAELDIDYRIIGGHMVTLLVELHEVSANVPLRETLDADFAALPEVIGDSRLVTALSAHAYAQAEAANRFVRHHQDAQGKLDLVIDVLAPSYRGVFRSNQQHGTLVVDEIPGVALTLGRPPMICDIHVRLTVGEDLTMRLKLPDVASALCLKALAYRGRFADKDAVDIWRLLNAAHSAGLTPDKWPSGVTGRDAATVLRKFFGSSSSTGLRQVSSSRDDRTRMRALIMTVVGRAL